MGKAYSADDVEVLKGLDKIKKNASMYIGATDTSGIFTIIREVCDNAVDEALAGRNDQCHIWIDEGYVYVQDNGNGMPVEIHKDFKKEKRSTLEVLFTEIHAGAKFKSGAYDTSKGTHGVGVKATNALSTHLCVYTCRDKQWYTAEFEEGVCTVPVKKVKSSYVEEATGVKPKKGTIICFAPNFDLFDKGSKIDPKMIRNWASLNAILNPKFHITFTPEGKATEEWYYEDGVKAFLETRCKKYNCSSLETKPLHVVHKHFDLVLSFTDADGNKMEAYTNTLFNLEGGNHLDVFHRQLHETLKPYAPKAAAYRSEDLREGLLGFINFKIDSPRFGSQTKEKLTDARFNELCEADLTAEFEAYWKKNKGLAKELCNRASRLRDAKQDFAISKQAAQKLKPKRGSTQILPGKLSEVKGIKSHDRELFTVEGDSAGGTAKSARMNNPRYQEILPLKGKILNAVKTAESKNPNKIWESEEVLFILKAIGFQPDIKNPLDNLRVGKLILLSDADVDGMHINALILSLLATHLPGMFDRGMVYLALPPRYIVQDSGTYYFGDTKAEMMKTVPKNLHHKISYLKGLGEMDAAALRYTAFNPETRKLVQLSAMTAADSKEIKKLMGGDTSLRKELLGVAS